MADGRRCEIGCQTWPDDDEYGLCLICGEETEQMSNVTPMNEDDARSLLNHLKFEQYYKTWDARQDPDRLLPN